jgi:hypothetical protein
MTDSAIIATAPNSDESVGCMSASSGSTHRISSQAIDSYDDVGCSFILGITPDANVGVNVYTDIVFSVFMNQRPRTFDDADVTFTAGNITKTTGDYSIIAFGTTMVVHLAPDDVPELTSEEYAVEINSLYSMSGTLNVILVIPPPNPLAPLAELLGGGIDAPVILTGTMPSGADITEVD